MNTNDLPDEIVQPLAQLGSALVEHVRAHRDHNLAEHEEGVLAAWRSAAPVLLEAVVQFGNHWAREERATDRGAVSAAARRAVAAQARAPDAPRVRSD